MVKLVSDAERVEGLVEGSLERSAFSVQMTPNFKQARITLVAI